MKAARSPSATGHSSGRFGLPVLVAIVLAIAVQLSSTVAMAQLRTIPREALRGTMSPVSGPNVMLNGNSVLLSAGAVIRDQRNMVIVPSALPAYSDVCYHLDSSGHIDRVWVLTDDERRMAPPAGG